MEGKILYRFKENKIFGDKKILLPAISTNNLIENNKKIKEENSLAKISMKNIIDQLNDELKNLREKELERKRSFVKDKFFSTQIYVNHLVKSVD